LYSNVDTLTNKLNEINIIKDDFDFLIFTEVFYKTNLVSKADQLDSFNIENFNMCSNENPERGVCVYTREGVMCKQKTVKVQNIKSLEFCFVEILKNNEKLLIGGIYRNQSIDKQVFNTDFNNLLTIINLTKYQNVIIVGDFNFPKICNWEKCDKLKGPEYGFIDILNKNDLKQIINKPTRFRTDQKQNILDLVITFNKNEKYISDLKIEAPVGKSDHAVVKFCVETTSINNKEYNKKEYYDYLNTNYDNVNKFLSEIDWSILNNMKCEDSWIFLEDKIHESITRYVPIKTLKKKKPPWMNQDIIKLVKRKKKAFKRYQENKSD